MYCISKELFVWIMAFITIDWVVNKTMFVILTKDTLTKFFKNLFTKGKKKKLTEPEPVTEVLISSDPPNERTQVLPPKEELTPKKEPPPKRKRPPKKETPPKPKIEHCQLCPLANEFGGTPAKSQLVAPSEPVTSTSNSIDEDKVFAICGAVLGLTVYAAFALLCGALSD